jgi:alpha-L-fucosidase
MTHRTTTFSIKKKSKNHSRNFVYVLLILAQIQLRAQTPIDETHLIKNADFEKGTLSDWNHWRTTNAHITADIYSGKYAVKIGPEKGLCNQEVKLRNNALYRLTAFVKTDSGAEEVRMIISEYGGAAKSVSSSLTSYTKVSIDFQTAAKIKDVLISFSHPSGTGNGFVDQVELQYLGEAPRPVLQEFLPYRERVPEVFDGVYQLSNKQVEWFVNDKFGMFIHWGVYSAMPEGSEWVRHQEAWSNEYYAGRARDTEKGFTAAKYNPAQWAALAKKAGMKYTVLTARHHDGYALFESSHPFSWTSKKDLGRDLIKEYTDAVRAAGLKVGLYYSPINWRYVGFYDPFGNNVLPNVWGYKTAAKWHKEDARMMKEEVYEQVTRLVKNYGKLHYIFWDGASLGQVKNKTLSTAFWDAGQYVNPENVWPVNEKYITKEDGTGKPLGMLGVVRKYQPDMLLNERFGWKGDVHIEEGGSYSAGDISLVCSEKCVSLQRGGWGFKPNSKVYSFEEVVMYLSNCVVRNQNLLLNVSPDREGQIPQNQQEVLIKIGDWLGKVGSGIYNTKAGPWQPLFGEYGFTYNGTKIYCHVYDGFKDFKSNSFTTQSIGTKTVAKVVNLFDGKELKWVKNSDNTVTISNIDYTQNPATTIIEITLKETVY